MSFFNSIDLKSIDASLSVNDKQQLKVSLHDASGNILASEANAVVP